MRSSFISWLAGGVIASAGVVGAQDQAVPQAAPLEGVVPAATDSSDGPRQLRRMLPPRHPMTPVVPEPNAVKARPIQGNLPTELPPLPEGVSDLKFSELFCTPVSDRGLELTDKLRALHGKRVRVLGYMVYESVTDCNSCVRTVAAQPPAGLKKKRIGVPALTSCVVPGRMMLTPSLVMLNHAHYGLADDLPPQTVFVRVADKRFETLPYTPGPMLLTGVLQVGNQQEPDGRISIVRLELDAPAAAQTAGAVPSQAPTISSSSVGAPLVSPGAR